MNTIPLRDLVVVVVIALALSGLIALPQFDWLRGLSIDLLTGFSLTVRGPRHEPAQSPIVVVVLDEETYGRKPFAGSPSITWTREIGRVLAAIVDGGAKVVGFDIIFPNTIEQSEITFGAETIGSKMRGFDREFLRDLANAARGGKLVLGEILGKERQITPSDAQQVAVGNERNIRPLNLYTDGDGVVRRVPLVMSIDATRTPSMSLELAARMLGIAPEIASGIRLGDYTVPSKVTDTLTLNFQGGANDFPTYSLADLRDCAEKGDVAYFRRHFAGRVVLIGALLDVEDHVLTSKRFATRIEGARSERCGTSQSSYSNKFARQTIAGVYVHATAVGNLLGRRGLKEFGQISGWLVGLGAALLSGVVVLALSFPSSITLLAWLWLLWLGIATFAFTRALVLPTIDVLAGGVLTLFATIAFRYMVADKDKRLLRRSFSFYLAPALIEKMIASNEPPVLGGEVRIVTLYRSDLAGFSALSEKLKPAELVSLMNDYLSAMTDIIHNHGGFVDKYIGDAIDGVFGAPLDDPDHAVNAVRAALACQAKLREMNDAGLSTFRGMTLRQRVGLHTGNGLVGNIGSRQRFNYTVMGDSANLASRLEGANKFYGTSIIASEATMQSAGGSIAWRELDTIRVVGRDEPIVIFEPLAVCAQLTSNQVINQTMYAEGLKLWRARDFVGAAEAFRQCADRDPPSSMFRERAMMLAHSPPGRDWRPVNSMESK